LYVGGSASTELRLIVDDQVTSLSSKSRSFAVGVDPPNNYHRWRIPLAQSLLLLDCGETVPSKIGGTFTKKGDTWTGLEE
jgi:hypothetical protein